MMRITTMFKVIWFSVAMATVCAMWRCWRGL
jgi:hypothetical protein